ncbi:7-carboxy-7-deazaguanine synthase QueE [Fulvivirga sedimenti]|uniref:7-carboxy-7-deazaguanine synthase n=1 Tax=Fulvivirga sedimenti TaxID=2879465 RepID=A0A9X1KVU5_9BACT|nr:7-carboxy-7-deazaguanine synthase QueE [Fulvivirga sedimenti]MCA6073264.1 7-carboxy-7-deazaguanine synthase QueE [Fulvivirga sedimenti]
MKIAKLSGNAEIFHTIQGEGKSSGLPCIFLRLSLCNLHCTWCDTDYTWNWEGTPFSHVNDTQPGYKKFSKEEQILEAGIEYLLEEISKFNCPNLVVTGGEPLMQQKDLAVLLQALREEKIIEHIEIETNGTLMPIADLDLQVDQYNVSPKLTNSGNPDKLRIRPEILDWFARSPKANFKFVCAAPKDLYEIEELIRSFGIPSNKVILMPLGTSIDSLDEREKWLTEICKNKGFRFSDRMHIRLFGNKRGV